jgi:hypothetical protein
MSDSREDVEELRGEANRLADGCHWRAEQHGWSEDRWRRRAYWAGFGSAAVSALGGAGSIIAGIDGSTDGAIWAGGVAVAGAVFSGYVTGIRPAEQAERHRVASGGFAGLRRGYRVLARVRPAGMEEARTDLKDLTGRHNQLEGDAVGVEAKAREKIDRAVQAYLNLLKTDGPENAPPPEDLPSSKR